MTTQTTLLFDLDGTLLDTNLDAFVPAYFQKLAGFLSPRIPPDQLVKYLMAGTRAMMVSQDPTRTLREVFNENFYPFLGVDYEALQPELETFYDDVFPSLHEIAKPIPGVVELIDWAFAAGHRVVIATSPLFPRKAVYHRLRWAGLPPEKYPFELVTSYEHFHFLKPFPAYFAEVLGRLGWPEGPVLMIGNDVEADLVPSAALGLATFHALDTASRDDFKATGQGYIRDLRPWLETTDPSTLVPAYTSPASFLAQLRATPAILAGLLDEVPSSAWTRRPTETDWSLTEILCHMRDVENEVDQPRIELIVRQEEPFIPGENPDTWAADRNYANQDGRKALTDFTTARLKTLETLARLEPAQWSRKARHAIFGPTSLQEMVSFNAEHDRLHVQQVCALLKSSH
jgi:FMN phosphatase YigB (HAD superfamily)